MRGSLHKNEEAEAEGARNLKFMWRILLDIKKKISNIIFSQNLVSSTFLAFMQMTKLCTLPKLTSRWL